MLRLRSLTIWLRSRLALTMSGSVILLFAVVGWLAARMVGGRTVFLLAYGMVAVIGFSWVLGRRVPALDASRSKLPVRVRVGQLVSAEVKLTARRHVSNVIVEEQLPSALGSSARLAVPSLARGQVLAHRYTFAPRRRGVHNVGPMLATWGDPFGLTKRQASLAKPQELIVHPAVEPVLDRVLARQWEDPPIRPRIQTPWPSGFEFYGMREYVPGDDPRRIVWRASARTLDAVTGTGRYLVRESEQGITDQVVLVLDTSTSAHSPGDPSETFETAVSVAASLGIRFLKDGFTVTIETNQRQIAARMRSDRNRIPLLDELAMVKRDAISFGKAFERLGAERTSGRHFVVITPRFESDAAQRLRLMIRKGASVTAAMIIGDEFDSTSAERAAAIGCNVILVRTGFSLDRAFQAVVSGGIK